jgi:peptidoglycan/LPS O-acetylase OafA/YrhL
LLWIGDRSYSIYVFQYFFEWVSREFLKAVGVADPGSPTLAVTYIAVCYCITELVYKFYEAPWRKKGREISKKIMAEKKDLLWQDDSGTQTAKPAL